jgi:hypothetical protein
MKKQYVKPDIYFDNFTLAVSVASCAVKATSTENICGVELAPDLIVFTSDVGMCNITQSDGEYNGLCYHVPLDANNVFGS